MDLEHSLQSLGLDEKEAKVYLTCLTIGQATALVITKAADLKRPTVYNVLESLQKRDLIIPLPKGTTTEYRAKDPEQLLANLKKQTRMAEDMLSTLHAIQPKSVGRPKITIAEGKKKMWDVYLEMFEADEIYFYGTDIEALSSTFGDILSIGDRMFRERKTRTKELMNSTPADSAYAKKSRNRYRQIRITPSDLRFFEDSAIWKNNIWIASIREPMFGVRIESESIAKTYRAIFEMAWRSAIDPA